MEKEYWIKIFIFYLGILFIFLATIFLNIIQKNKENKYKTPLKRDVERPPGYSLQKKIEDINFDLGINTCQIPLLYMIITVPFLIKKNSLLEIGLIEIIIFVIADIIAFIGIGKLIKNFLQKKKIKLAYECELVVGQDFNKLEKNGYHVLHDFQAKNYNIDHIIIGPSGVYVIETKGRSKLKGKEGAHKLYYDGKCLKFPKHIETKPIEQVLANAESLSRWIFENTNKKYNVQAILAFPGWHYNRVKNLPEKAPMIFSGRNVKWITDRKTVLNQQDIWDIYQLIRKRCLIIIEDEKITIPQ